MQPRVKLDVGLPTRVDATSRWASDGCATVRSVKSMDVGGRTRACRWEDLVEYHATRMLKGPAKLSS